MRRCQRVSERRAKLRVGQTFAPLPLTRPGTHKRMRVPGGGGLPYFVGYGFVSSRCPTVCSGPLFMWEQPCDPGTSQRPTPPYLFSPVPLLNLLACIGFISILRSTPVPSPCLGLREPCLGKGRRVRAARMEEGPGERKSASDHSSSVCEVTERLPGWSPAFPLESPGLHSRKEPALFTTWPEPSPALSRPRQGLGGAARPGFPLCRASSLRPFQLGL